MAKANDKRSILLDVDPGIIERNMTIIKENSLEDEIKNLFPTPTVSSIVVKPSPGFCVKTKESEGNRKIFVNICYTEAIPAPEDITEDDLIDIVNSEEPSNYKIPMSIGEAREEFDKSGQPSIAYDVAINGTFYKKLHTSKIFHTFFLNVVFEGLQNKYGFGIDMYDYILLKNRKCVGNLQTHRIQKRITDNIDNSVEEYKPFIEIIGSDNDPNTKKQSWDPIDYQLIREPAEGKIEYLVAEFKINNQLRHNDILLDVGEDRIIVKTIKTNQMVDLFVPFNIKENSVRAVLNMNNNILIVTMAVQDPKLLL